MATRLEQLQQMLLEDPHDPFLRYAIALEYGTAGNLSEAISRIEQLLTEKPDYLGAYYQLGKYYEQQNEMEKAKAVYEKGMTVAQQQRNMKTLGELRTAIDLLEE